MSYSLTKLDALARQRQSEIQNAPDALSVPGKRYYVSTDGDDENDGTPDHPWKSLKKVSSAPLSEGDGVFFKRGDTFRGCFSVKDGVTYGAYGQGEKPKFYGWEHSLADEALWVEVCASPRIWKLKEPILDCGTLVFNEGQAHSRKLIPSYIRGRFVCREDEDRLFEMEQEMTRDLDLVCFYEERLTTSPSKGEDFPIPIIDENSLGSLYLRCDKGNPGKIFASIEALPKRNMIYVGGHKNVRIDNLCLKYIGAHAISAGGRKVVGLHVTGCEIGWVGGTIQHYFGTDPNYPQGRRGTVTRYGNGVEIYGGCDDYLVQNCYIYQIYDAAMTHQITTNGSKFVMSGIRYLDNLVEKCVYGIEYFLEKNEGDTESYMENLEIAGNILRQSGYGWGQQRHNTDTPALIKGWSYENTARDFTIHHNIFDRCAYRLLHLVAKEEASLPRMEENTYIQSEGGWLGQYGANAIEEPPILVFDGQEEARIRETLGDSAARILVL